MNLEQPQLRLEAPAPTGMRPLWSMNGAMGLLGAHEWELETWINSGAVKWVFNIAGKYADKQELRFWIRGLLAVQRQKPQPKMKLTEVIAEICGPALVLKGAEVCAILNCTNSHMAGLATDGEIKPLNGALAGKHIHYRIEAKSVRAFLERRLVC